MTPIPVLIRNASQANVDAVLELLRDAKLPVDDVASIFGECFAIAVVNDSIAGTAAVETHGEFGLFRSAAVRADLRGKGIGEALTKNRIEWARAHGIRELYLLTTTAAAYFPKLGFQNVARDSVPDEIKNTKEFTTLCPSSAAAMLQKL